MTQAQLGAKVGCSREMISRIERDLLDNMQFGRVQTCVATLGGWLRVDVTWQGERLPRLLDERHARLQDRFVRMLEAYGWLVWVEVSFNEFGDRGRIDVLAWHPAGRVLLVAEIKPALGDAQDTLGRLDVKRRVAPALARERGWEVDRIVPCLVLEEGNTQRRHVAALEGLFRRYGLRGRAALGWLRRPRAETGGLLLFLTPGG